jgi:hypothetical protein
MNTLHKIIATFIAIATIVMPMTVSAQYYGYNNQYPQYYNSLSAYCYATPANVRVGETVVWRVSMTGGSSPYQYQWSGTDGLYGNDYVVSKTYSTPGVKTGNIIVYSNGQSLNVSCSQNVTVDGYYYGNNYYNNNTNYYQQGYQYPYQYQQPQPVYTPPVVYQQTVTAPPVIPAETVQYTEVQYQAPVTKVVSVTKTNDQDIANAGAMQYYGNQQTNQSASGLFSLSDVPWGLILLFIFLIMFGTVIYILSTKK